MELDGRYALDCLAERFGPTSLNPHCGFQLGIRPSWAGTKGFSPVQNKAIGLIYAIEKFDLKFTHHLIKHRHTDTHLLN